MRVRVFTITVTAGRLSLRIGSYDKSESFGALSTTCSLRTEKIDVAELRPFAGSHPEIMADWLNNSAELTFEPDESYRLTRRDLRNRLRFWVEERFGLEISKKHYKDLGH